MKKKVVALLMAMAMTVTALTGCGGGETPSGGNDQQANNDGGEVKTEAIELKVWSAEEDLEITKQMCDRFDEEHEEWDITFDISILGVDETCENVKTDPETAADVFLIPSGSIPEMTAAGLLYPITYDLDTLKSLYSEGAMSACTKDDLLYGIPITPNAWFMYYNKSMYTEDEVKSLDTMMAKDLGDGIANFSCALTNSWYIEAFFYGAGCTLFGPDGTNPNDCTWNNAAGLAAGKYLIGLANNPKYVEDIDGLAGSLMKEGKLGALCSGTWSANDLKEALGENYGACALPTFTIDGKECQLSNFADYKCFTVKSNTKYPLAAQQLAAYFANEENQLLRYETNLTTPTCISLQEHEALKDDLATLALLAQTEHATPQPAITQIAEYWTPAQALGEGIINKEITEANLQEKLDSLVTSVTTKLSDN